jgi:trafficking protein particle complex subunit 5
MSSRFSVLSATSSAEHLPSPRHSTPPVSLPARKTPTRPTIHDRPLNKTRTAEVSASAFQFLFSELIQYSHKRVDGIADLEKRRVHEKDVYIVLNERNKD